jgi:cytoskeleton protein RodZ
MPPIGETLREARLRQGVDIAEVEQATKIRAKYLRALESEEFDRLPGATFVRTFLRSYAEYLGLDSQLLLEEFRQRHESPREEDLRPLGPPPPASRPVAREGRRRLPGGGVPSRGAMIAGAVAAILALLLLIGLLTGEGDDEPGEPTAASERAGEGGGGQERQRERRQRSAEDEDVTLQVSPFGETYVCVEDADGQEIFEQTIAAPETFEGEALRVNFGNTQVELELNGDEVPIEQSPNPVAFEFTPEGEEELPEAERPCT